MLFAITDRVHIHCHAHSLESRPCSLSAIARAHALPCQVSATIHSTFDARCHTVFACAKMQIFVFVRAEYLSPNGKLNQVVLWDSIIQQKVWTGQGVLCSIMTLHPLITGAMP